ncbi:conserved Plasmodium protein, unknown function [Plasmodium berghei]|uniref:Fam-a protein n=1 Tax=Plasmodium berghei TaxID=5821 RepID=A0A1D3SKE9_PLABE|nr:conserved Plasmodium protein, unknown function [Plasmodium berghei]
MKYAFFLFFFFLIFINYKVITEKCDKIANVSNPPNTFSLSLNKIKITTLDILSEYKKERTVITKVFEQNQHENNYIFINEKINSYNSININCTFKVKKKIDKTKILVILVKHFEGDIDIFRKNNKIDHLKKYETFIFTNRYENDMIVSNLSLLLVNLTEITGYYKFDVFITDGKSNLMVFKLVKIFLYFHNNIPIIQYPIKKGNMGSIIIENICKNKLMINNNSLNIFNKLVVHNFKEYYPQPLISEREYFTHNYINKSSENRIN